MGISERKRDNKRRRRISDEEIMEYLANRAQKKAIKAMKSLKTQTDLFVWPKKIEKDVRQGTPIQMFSIKAEKKRLIERMEEIERIKKRKTERAAQKQLHEDERARMARSRAQDELNDWEKKEREFDLAQSKIRSEIRLHQGRAKPIDILCKHLNHAEDDFCIEVDEPYKVFKGLTVKELEEVHEDIRMYQEMDKETPRNVRYWEALMVICDWELAETRKKDAWDRARVVGEKQLSGFIAEDMGEHQFLEGKTCAELEAIQSKIDSDMRSGKAMVVEYWEALTRRLDMYKAKAFMKEIHAKMLQKHLEHGSYSPELVHGDEKEEAIYPEVDMAILENNRVDVLEEQEKRIQEALALRSKTSSEDNLETIALKAMGAMGNGDEVFGNRDEVKLDLSHVYWWHDKYRTRKPKYFNRIHIGYEWNKYNRIHYDQENPPPKMVQGYKFNIFYPDLVDKAKTPSYVIKQDSDSDDTCIIHFQAGPPYEDIAFRIVNKEWDYSHKRGFKCKFENGILQVYFNFRRYRYRR